MRREKTYCVYILTNKNHTTLYVGVTNNLYRRMYEHKNGLNKGFSKRYNLHHLVYFDCSNDINAAITFEKRLKGWRREWKEELITQFNPKWDDLSCDWFKKDPGSSLPDWQACPG